MMRTAAAIAALTLPLVLAGCEIGYKKSQQTGYRGAGLQQITDADNVKKAAAIPVDAYALPPDGGPTAGATYQNVQVLGGVSAERFNHLMAQLNNWVVPANAAPSDAGCNYCHNPENMASDEKYTKVVSRQMIRMTQDINARWASHVQGTGVTCWTCHRGNAVPEYKWALTDQPGINTSLRGNRRGQNAPDANVGYASLPYDPFDHYLRAPNEIRVASSSPYPSFNHRVSIKEAEASYGLMMHVSQSLGVNCTYCHNTQSFRAWSLSRAQRATAYYGIRMVRGINDGWITPLTPVFPANRKGPHGDVYKVSCMTCHQGLAKPLNGARMLAANPTLRGSGRRPVAAEAPPAAVQEALENPGAMTGSQ